MTAPGLTSMGVTAAVMTVVLLSAAPGARQAQPASRPAQPGSSARAGWSAPRTPEGNYAMTNILSAARSQENAQR
jgi:hypothetical protein